MVKTIFTSFLILFTSYFGYSQANFNDVKLDNYFNILEQNNKFMGSVAISKNGKIFYTKTVGFTDIDKKLKSNEETKYRIGSITKTFTTVLVFKAIEKNKLTLNQTIDKWFPLIKNSTKITVKDLLNHRSGIHNFTNDPDYIAWSTQTKNEKEMLKIIASKGSDFEPNSKSVYSNSNFVLLSYILEKTFKKSYSEVLKEYISEPLELKNTYVFGKINTNKNECKSYKFIGSWEEEPETNFTIPLGAGAITSNPKDLTTFANALFTNKILKPKSLETMKTLKDGYGLGLFQYSFNNIISYGHTGAIDGFSSIFKYFPNEKISYALISNGTNLNNNDISIAIFNAIYNKPYKIPVFKTFVNTSEELDKYLGVYSSNIIPLKITITKNGNTIIAQGSGQPAFPLEATKMHEFKFDQAGAKFKFKPKEKTMSLFQRGGEIIFTKE